MVGKVTATLQSKGKERYDVYDMTSQRPKKKMIRLSFFLFSILAVFRLPKGRSLFPYKFSFFLDFSYCRRSTILPYTTKTATLSV